MHTKPRNGSYQLRTAIALCVFIIIATIPLQFIGIQSTPRYMFKLPTNDKGKVDQQALYCKIDYIKKHIDLRYQNHIKVKFPKDDIEQLSAKIILRKTDSPSYIIPPSDIDLSIDEKNQCVLLITAKSASIFPPKKKSPDKIKTKTKQDSNTPVKTVKPVSLKGYTLELSFQHNGEFRAMLKGVIKNSRHVEGLTLTRR